MHRTRTRFAARVNRVATGLERRGIVATYRLHDRVLANRASRRRYAHEPTTLDESQQEVVDRLRKDGYATVPLTELVPDPGGKLFDGLVEGGVVQFLHEGDDVAVLAATKAVVPANLGADREGG